MNKYILSVAVNKQDTRLTPSEVTFEQFCRKIELPVVTPETVDEYIKMNAEEKSAVKDQGGFVAGKTKDGSRRKDSIEFRSMLTLDADHATKDLINNFSIKCPWKACYYSTHSHTAEKPRLRIVIPLKRNIDAEEHAIISQYVASKIGIKYFDECSFRVNQLMYWPSVSCDGEYLFNEVNDNLLDPDELLALVTDECDSATFSNLRYGKTCQDPLSKDGIIGVFNRKYYPISKALDELIPGTYVRSRGNRYRYFESNNLPGAMIIEDKFLYSYHAKDPANGKMCSAFDIVRIHKLGINATCTDMINFAINECGLKINIKEQVKNNHSKDSCNDWKDKLVRNKNGEIASRLTNACVIIEKDEALQNFRYNAFSDDIEVTGPLPWRNKTSFWSDADDAQLACYFDKNYGRFSAVVLETAFKKCADDRTYHPVLDYLNSLPAWDEHNRVETLLIDYLGAEDNIYTRECTRIILVAAVLRILHPGIKFDYIVVLNGEQGIGKSTLLAKIGMDWFSDSLAISDMNDKTAAEKVQGNWILEISEMAGMRKAETEKVKAFISRQIDKYRKAFGRKTSPHPRQCVFFGTTNSETGFLRDTTGNRRYLNIICSGNSKLKPWDIEQDTVDQIWAEAYLLAKKDFPLILDKSVENLAINAQNEAMEYDERQGIVQDYLNMFVPPDWNEMSVSDRQVYLMEYKGIPEFSNGYHQREKICNLEIWCECFMKSKEDIRNHDSYKIKAIMQRIPEWESVNSSIRFPIYGKQRYYKRNK